MLLYAVITGSNKEKSRMETVGNGYRGEAVTPLCQIRASRSQSLRGAWEREYRSRRHSIPVLADVICRVR